MSPAYSHSMDASWILAVHWVNSAIVIAVLGKRRCSKEKSPERKTSLSSEMFLESFGIVNPPKDPSRPIDGQALLAVLTDHWKAAGSAGLDKSTCRPNLLTFSYLQVKVTRTSNAG